MTYLIILLILLYLALIHDLKGVKKNTDLHLGLVFWVFFLLTGLRHGNGGDTYQYRIFWDFLPTFSSASYDELTSFRYEIGWVLLSFLIKNTLGSFVFLQLIISWCLNRGLFDIVKKHAKYPFVTLLLFYIAGEQFFWIEFEFMRQSASVAIFWMWGFKYLNNKQILKYLFTVVICTLFHFASVFLIFFPLIWYIDFSKKKNVRNIIVVMITFIILSIGAYNFTPFVTLRAIERFSNNMESLSFSDNEIVRVIHILYYYLFYYFIILIGILFFKIKIKFKAALFLSVFICSIAPYSYDTLRLMFFIIIFIDLALAETLVCMSNKKIGYYIVGTFIYMSVSNIIFYRKYSNPEYTLYIYPYYSWFEEEPESHKAEMRGRSFDGVTIPLQIYDPRKK